MGELGVPLDDCILFCDNQGAIKLAKNPEFHERSKHFDIKYHFVRERYQKGDFRLEYIPSKEQKADMFTKALSKEAFESLRDQIGLTRSMSN